MKSLEDLSKSTKILDMVNEFMELNSIEELKDFCIRYEINFEDDNKDFLDAKKRLAEYLHTEIKKKGL